MKNVVSVIGAAAVSIALWVEPSFAQQGTSKGVTTARPLTNKVVNNGLWRGLSKEPNRQPGNQVATGGRLRN
jgi:hypothetical protein